MTVQGSTSYTEIDNFKEVSRKAEYSLIYVPHASDNARLCQPAFD